VSSSTDSSTLAVSGPSLARRVLVVVGLFGYLATGLVYLAAGLVVPGPWFFLLIVLWLVGLWFVAVHTARWSWWVAAAGPVALLFWWAYVSLGELLLGWTA
jgi:hypothetical protein